MEKEVTIGPKDLKHTFLHKNICTCNHRKVGKYKYDIKRDFHVSKVGYHEIKKRAFIWCRIFLYPLHSLGDITNFINHLISPVSILNVGI